MKKRRNLALLLLAVLILIFINRGEDLDFSDYYSLEIKGYNGLGYVEVQRDDDKLKDKSESKKKFFESISYEVHGSDKKLKNGDLVEVIFNYDDELANKAKINVKSNILSKEAQGLDQPQTIDLFEKISLSFSGYDNKGRLDMKDQNQVDFSYDLKIDKKEGLKNGDKIKLSLDYDQEDLNRKGIIISQKEKEFLVTGLKEKKVIKTEDLFKNMAMEFEGKSPDIELKLKNKLPKELKEVFSFEISKGKKDKYKVGDKIGIKLVYDLEKLEELNYKIEGKEVRYFKIKDLKDTQEIV